MDTRCACRSSDRSATVPLLLCAALVGSRRREMLGPGGVASALAWDGVRPFAKLPALFGVAVGAGERRARVTPLVSTAFLIGNREDAATARYLPKTMFVAADKR